MEDEKANRGLREHEKFWAFVALLVAIVGLVILSSTFDKPGANATAAATASDIVLQGKLRIIDSAVAGLLAILGMAAQALFRISQVDRIQAEANLEREKKSPASPAPAPALRDAVEQGARDGTREGVEDALAPKAPEAPPAPRYEGPELPEAPDAPDAPDEPQWPR